jgi:hypothetical protein
VILGSPEKRQHDDEIERVRNIIRLLKLALDDCYAYLAKLEEEHRRNGH